MKRIKIRKFASNIAISFFFTSLFVLLFYYILDDKVSKYISLINTVAIERHDIEVNATYDFSQKRLIDYPNFGNKYARIKISSIDLDLPVYHGDTLKILRYGVGHYAGSYFPGENGTIIMDAHNTSGYFKKLDQVKVNDKIVIETNYGVFTYIVENTKVVSENDLDAFKVSHDGEKLLLYTCYPINRSVVGRKTKRYVVYATLEEEHNE